MCVCATAKRRRRQLKQTKSARRFFATRQRAVKAVATPIKAKGKK